MTLMDLDLWLLVVAFFLLLQQSTTATSTYGECPRTKVPDQTNTHLLKLNTTIIEVGEHLKEVVLEAVVHIYPSPHPWGIFINIHPPTKDRVAYFSIYWGTSGIHKLGMMCNRKIYSFVSTSWTTTPSLLTPLTIMLQVGSNFVRIYERLLGEDKLAGQLNCSEPLSRFRCLEMNIVCISAPGCVSINQPCGGVPDEGDGGATCDGNVPGDGVAAGDGDVLGDGVAAEDGDVPGDGEAAGDGDVADDGVATGDGDVTGDGRATGDGDIASNGVAADDGYVAGDGVAAGNGEVPGDGRATGDGDVAGDGVAAGDGDIAGDGTNAGDGKFANYVVPIIIVLLGVFILSIITLTAVFCLSRLQFRAVRRHTHPDQPSSCSGPQINTTTKGITTYRSCRGAENTYDDTLAHALPVPSLAHALTVPSHAPPIPSHAHKYDNTPSHANTYDDTHPNDDTNSDDHIYEEWKPPS